MSGIDTPLASLLTPQIDVPTDGEVRRGLTIVAALVATLLLFGLVGFQALIVGTQSTLDDLDSKIASAERENQRLRLDVAQLEAPDRIRDFALAFLGMVEPDTVLYLEPLTAAELGEGEGDG